MFTPAAPGNPPPVRYDSVDPHRSRSDAFRVDPAEGRSGSGPGLFDAVLFDRDGTLVHDVPYNGDPDLVRPVSGARAALDRLRAAGFRLGVVTNQSGLARGRFTEADLDRVHARIDALLGPFDTWQVCPHAQPAPGVERGCRCRKPAPGLIWDAARALRTVPARCVVVGDIGADMIAAGAAGAAGILVPTPVTRVQEVAAAPAVAGDLAAAVDLILRRQRLAGGARRVDVPTGGAGTGGSRPTERRRRPRTVLVARPDSAGDVLVTGPAIRAVAAGADRVVMLCGPRGRAAAEMLPGIDELIEWRLPWIDPEPGPVDRDQMQRLIARLAEVGADEAVLFTSFHQSALPLALVLRMTGVRRISAISDDYPGSLLDVRHRVSLGIPEAERALSLAVAAGFALPAGDDPVLRLRADCLPDPSTRGQPAEPGYVVVHPGASVPARACPPERYAEIVRALVAAGHRVVVTGGPGEGGLSARVAGHTAIDLGGQTSLTGLAGIIARAGCLVVGNTGPAHLAAALGVPVVSLFAPTVPFGQWGPYRVPVVRLGDAAADCRHTRATICPVPGHPCLSDIEAGSVVTAVRLLDAEQAGALGPVGAGPGRAGQPGARRRGGLAMNILLWHVHGSWTTAFVHGKHRYLVPVTPDRGPYGLGRARTYPWPDTVEEVSPAELADEDVDLIILQRPEEFELARDWLRRRPGRDLPAIFVEHNTPKGDVPNSRHPMADRTDLLIAHVTHFNALFWDTGDTRSTVIEHGIVEPTVGYTGELDRLAVVVNDPVRRWRVTGTDLLPRFAEIAPLDVFGMRVTGLAEHLGLPDNRLTAYDDLPQHQMQAEIGRRRAYLHLCRWTSLGLSLIEAMALGMPVVVLAATEAVAAVPPGAGVLATRLDTLLDAARWLIDDPAAAHRLGAQASEVARTRYGLDRFLADWDRVLEEELCASR